MNKTIEAESVLLAGLNSFASLSIYAQPQASVQPRLPFLHVAVAGGLGFSARIELTGEKLLAAVSNDAKAIYPMRIGPTCGYAFRMSLDAIHSANYAGLAAVGDGPGNPFTGGKFIVTGRGLKFCDPITTFFSLCFAEGPVVGLEFRS